MALEPDLYSILTYFAKKNCSPTIDLEPFIVFLERYAAHYVREKPEWTRWSKDTSIRVWEDLTRLIAEEKCQILNHDGISRVYMLRFFSDLLEQAYEFPDDTAKLPFPNEQNLKITIPPEQIRPLDIMDEMTLYLDNPQTRILPIIRLKFPRNVPSILVLAPMVPRRFMECAMLKIRYYLQNPENKEYMQRRLSPKHQGKETTLREILNMAVVRPFDCVTNIESGSDSSYFFWACFCATLKADSSKKEEFLPEEIALTQSAYIIEIVNSYYRSKAAKQREVELSFKALEVQIDKPPYAYTLDTIVKFTNSNGLPLLGQYSRQQLEGWLEERITATGAGKIPELLVIDDGRDTQWYIKKNNLFPFTAKLIADTQPRIKLTVSDRWKKILRDYRVEKAMNNDDSFERLIYKLTANLSPILIEILKDPRLFLIYDDLLESHEAIPENYKFFNHGELIPLHVLFSLKRKTVLGDTKLMLPIWYSIPIITAIIGFFRHLKRKKVEHDEWEDEKPETEKAALKTGRKREANNEAQSAVRELAADLTPQGYTIAAYLKELQENWSKLIDKNSKDDFIADVNALIRDRLRQFTQSQKHERITSSLLSQLSNSTIDENKALNGLNDRDSLFHYVRLYMLNLILNKKI